MADTPKTRKETPFPTIQPDMVSRLSQEADLRTIQPQTVDWAEIHRQAEEARKKSG
ncbi:hypothetical protein SAMN04488515_2115 [Cognatiyoonia koreensis]|uniref:Uncharacterized protein n=1 Tax=Cognatiyoonia koreensis TaxID=364200 RepID=A0A1I0QSI2_9RHOB|nr:hypothetical protein [Cognatiyoonia koreensis]SEW29868.1 hypothetical protein SAMN04488515_2115 [Cognatiyoonia koreensis]